MEWPQVAQGACIQPPKGEHCHPVSKSGILFSSLEVLWVHVKVALSQSYLKYEVGQLTRANKGILMPGGGAKSRPTTRNTGVLVTTSYSCWFQLVLVHLAQLTCVRPRYI